MPPSRIPRAVRALARGDEQAARIAATALLARRDFLCRELTERLRRQGFEEPAAARAVAELVHEGLLNEGRCAQNYVAYHAARGQGPIRIAAELRRRGLSEEPIEAALASGPDWNALAHKVFRAKFGPQPPANWAQRARQARFLQYRGFSSDHIRSAIGADPDTGFAEL
jgi:regulatory protein